MYPQFEVGPEPGAEGDVDSVSQIVELWRSSISSRDDVLGDILQRRASGEITDEQAHQAALQLGLVSPDKES